MVREHKLITLSQASKTKYYKKLVYIQIHVTGKAVLPYQVPKEIKITCKTRKSCKGCKIVDLKKSKNECILKISETDPELIKFIGTNELHFTNIIRKMYNTNPRCMFKHETVSVYTVEEIYMSELSTIENLDTNISRVGYCINFSVDCNAPYLITCYAYPEPKSQKIVHIITKAEKLKTNLDKFELSKKEKKEVQIFNPVKKISKDKKENTSKIYTFLENLYDVYSANVTRIFKRFDLHMAIDLVFHSPLQFYFNNEFVHKGWLDVIVIGDTRCGKGYVSENLIKYYGYGEIVSGENVSFAGLVGGVQQIQGRWVATWGKIPLNNKKLVIIDEFGEMDPKDISRLSRIRSEGIAEITKIHTERTDAMTRLIFLANPKNRLVSSYSFGIEAITDLVENSEDISRFDYALVVSQNEVDIHEINQYRKKSKNIYAKADPLLIQWIWSRSPEQIKFTKEAEALILEYAVKLGNIYSPKIPLIQGENIRIKLARVSAAIAGRLFSCDSKNRLIIEEFHVQAAYIFLNLIYKKNCSGYYHISQIHNKTQKIYNQKLFEDYINSFENKDDLINYFMSNNYITVTDISECINQPKEVARELISKLLHHRCIMKKYTFYVKNKCFTDWLKSY
jgi:hypothetical protein